MSDNTGLEWEECEISGHHRAEGDKGTYWIYDSAGKLHIEYSYATHAGMEGQMLRTQETLEDAKAVAEKFDRCKEL